MDNCCESMVKYFMLLVNLIFAIAGIFLIGVGTFIQVNAKTYLDFLSDNYLNTPIFIIVLGVIIFVVAFFGCCGAWQESSCMIYIYAMFISVLLICECGAAIAAFMLKSDLKDVMQKKFKDGMQNYGTEGHAGVTNTWNTIQHDLQCCGVVAPGDWLNSTYGKIPSSCCSTTTTDDCEEKDAYPVGCLALAEDKFVGNIAVVGGVALGVAFLQFLGVIFSCCLANRIKKNSQYV